LRQFQPEDFALSHPGGSLGRKLLTKVSDIMHEGERLPLVTADAALKEVVFEISNKGLGLVAVVDEQQHMLGVITDGDLRRVLDGEHDVRLLSAKDIMTVKPKVIHISNMAIDAVDIVNEYKIGGLLVVDDNNKVVGAFNVHDLFQAKLI
jgi:arabinose-5-phosphate isomerase